MICWRAVRESELRATSPPDSEILKVARLGTFVEVYESKHYPIAPANPVGAIKFHMDNTGMTVADLVPYIGPTNRVYEVLKGTRPVTMHMVRRLIGLGIPASSLVGEPEPVAA